MNKLGFHIYRTFHVLILLAFSLLIASCDEDTDARTEGVEILFHENNGMEWNELSSLIDILASSGHFHILVNGVQINLPPRVPLYDSVSDSERLKIHVYVNDGRHELDYKNHFASDSLDRLEKFLSKNPSLRVVALSFDGDCEMNDVLEVMEIFNSLRISFSLERPHEGG